jgi:hypothetical protein
MRVPRPVQILTVLATLATLAACGSMGRGPRDQPDPNYSSTSVAVVWDSGPLDRAYQGERTSMDTRHSQEIASPRANESADQRVQRQETENKDLESRYTQGKASHSQTLPPSDHHGQDQGKSDKSN